LTAHVSHPFQSRSSQDEDAAPDMKSLMNFVAIGQEVLGKRTWKWRSV
jgi:hypothetical protein